VIVAIYNAAIPNRMAASVEPVSVESRSAGFLNTPNYRPIWVMEV